MSGIVVTRRADACHHHLLALPQAKASTLLAELSKECAEHEATQHRAQAAVQSHAKERQEWSVERAALEVSSGH